jgi:hypothetical protein
MPQLPKLLCPSINALLFFNAESNTSWAYFVILEAGLTIIAVNLPSLWYYLAGVTPEGVLRSIRSVISLGSGRGGSQSSLKTGKPESEHATENKSKWRASRETNSSHSNMVDRGEHHHLETYPKDVTSVVETYAMTDSPGQQRRTSDTEPTIAQADQQEGIRVDHSIQRTEEEV